MPAVSTTSRYAFLGKPPQKKRPTQLKPVAPVNVILPLPVTSPVILVTSPSVRRRSATLTSIGAWAAAAQPGSPVRYSRRGSGRGSITHSRTNSSSSILHLLESPGRHPTTAKDSGVLLAAPIMASSNEAAVATGVKSASKSSLTLKRIRSLGVLRRPRSRSTSSNPSSPTRPTPSRTRSKSILQPAKQKPKVKTNLPPTLANELLLLQFMDGGSLETNMKRLMKKQAKRAAKNGTAPSNSAELPVADAYRDGKGGFWRDQDEEMEYAPLVPSGDVEEDGYESVHFDTEIFVQNGARQRPDPKLDDVVPPTAGFEDSFDPNKPLAAAIPAAEAKVVKKKKSRMDVRNLFSTK